MSHQINLFNPALKVKRSWANATALVVLVVATIAALSTYGVLLGRKVQAAEARAAVTAAEVKKVRDQLVREAAAVRQEPSRALADEVARLEQAAAVRQQIVSRLQGSEVGSVEGFGRYLEALARQRIAGVWLTGVSVSGQGSGDVFIRGRALSPELLPQYIQVLNGEQALRGKVINEMKMAERSEERLPASAATSGQAGSSAVSPAGSPLASASAQRLVPTKYIEFSLGSRPTSSVSSGG